MAETLGVITAVCMVILAVRIWRVANSLLTPGGEEGPGYGGLDPMDRPGDGGSPHDRFLRELLTSASTIRPNG